MTPNIINEKTWTTKREITLILKGYQKKHKYQNTGWQRQKQKS